MDPDWCVVGLTPASTEDGRKHIDGAACVITPDDCVAVAEERISRLAHAGGSELAVRAVLAAVGRIPLDVDRWVLSTCGEGMGDAPGSRSLGSRLHASLHDLGVQPGRIAWAPSHHLSHAYAAGTLAEPGDLIAVVDDAGSETTAGRLERASAYEVYGSGEPVRIATVSAPSPGGLGSLYRDATTRLGFRGQTECGKTMALAAFESGLALPGPLVENDPMLAAPDAGDRIESVLAQQRPARWTFRSRSWGDAHVSVARAVQATLEDGLVRWLSGVVSSRDVRPRRLIMAGGVALNCRAMGLLSTYLPVELVVHHNPGDTGQALGNALLAARELGRSADPVSVASSFTGPPPTMQQFEFATRLPVVTAVEWLDKNAAAAAIAERLAAGEVVGMFEGRSEYGPRALGHRSILANPRDYRRLAELNEQKGREPFRPFGMAVATEDAAWVTGTPGSSPAMLLALVARPEAAAAAPAGVHVDGTTRLQTVDPHVGLLHEVLTHWRSITGVPALINTSFNAGGEPIVETPAEAVDTATRLGLDTVGLVTPSRVALLRLSGSERSASV